MKNNIEIQTGVYYKTKNGSMVEPLQNVYWLHPIVKVGFHLFLEPQTNILYTNKGIAVYNENLKHSEQCLKDLAQLNIVSKYIFEEQELIDYKTQLLADKRLVSLARLQ